VLAASGFPYTEFSGYLWGLAMEPSMEIKLNLKVFFSFSLRLFRFFYPLPPALLICPLASF
jgi:hypothetical protein